jgi:hypothetical protein
MPDDILDILNRTPTEQAEWMRQAAEKTDLLATSARRWAYAAVVLSGLGMISNVASLADRWQRGEGPALPLLFAIVLLSSLGGVVAFGAGFAVGVRRRRSAL